MRDTVFGVLPQTPPLPLERSGADSRLKTGNCTLTTQQTLWQNRSVFTKQKWLTIVLNSLYQSIHQVLNQYVPLDWSAQLRQRLVDLVAGILHSHSASPARIAQSWQQLGISAAQVDSLERRVRRIENDRRLSAATCLHPLAQDYLQTAQTDRLYLILDATSHTDQVMLLMAGVWYRGQCLPLAWQTWAANVPLQGAGFWQRVAQMLATVARLLPAGVEVIWLADRAFGTPHFTDLLQPYGWHFIVRVQGQTRFQDRTGRCQPLSALAGKRRRAKGSGQVFKSSGWRALSVVVYHGRRHRTPLCLVSDLPPTWDWVEQYQRRYGIECLFRDYKSQGWHWEQSQVRQPEHVECLLVGMALATWLTLLLGTQVAHEALCQPATGRRASPPPVSRFSLFQLGLQRLAAGWLGNCHQTIAWWLGDWTAPNWSDQIRHHHAYAFVMGTMSSVVKRRHYLKVTVRP